MKGSYMAQEHEPVMISITSGKGGVGKTSIAINLGYGLLKKGKRVLLVDGDLGLANVDVMFGLDVKATIRDILEKGADPIEAVVYVEDGFGVLPASSGVPEMVTLGTDEQNAFVMALKTISRDFDYVLLDTAAGIGSAVLWFNDIAKYNMVILNPNPTSLTDAYALIKTMSKRFKRERFYVALNATKQAHEGRVTYESLAKASKKFLDVDLEYLGSIPDDNAVNLAVGKQIPFMKDNSNSRASVAVMELAERVIKFK